MVQVEDDNLIHLDVNNLNFHIILKCGKSNFNWMSDSRSMPMETPMRTPMHPRPYLNMQQLMHQSPQNHGVRSPNMIQETNSLMSDEGGVIFGTNISTGKVFRDI